MIVCTEFIACAFVVRCSSISIVRHLVGAVKFYLHVYGEVDRLQDQCKVRANYFHRRSFAGSMQGACQLFS